MTTYPTKVNFLLKDKAYDLATNAPLPLDELSGPELIDTFNRIVAVAIGIPDFRVPNPKAVPVIKFASKEAGVKRIAALHSSIVAFIGGHRAEAEAAAAKRAKATQTTKAAGSNGAGRTREFPMRIIHVLKKELAGNGKRDAYYKEGMPVGTYVNLAVEAGYSVAAAEEHVRYDVKCGFISLEKAGGSAVPVAEAQGAEPVAEAQGADAAAS